MGLLQMAYETYENLSHYAGVPREGHPTLLPLSHISQKAQIEIVLDRDGAFVRASEVPKEGQQTVIPATIESGSRSSSTIAPHPLCEQLEFLAPFGGEKHEAYWKGLTAWAESPHSHPKVRAVAAYIGRGTILTDLAAAGLVQLDGSGNPAKGKLGGADYRKCLVRWCVLDTGARDRCWEDPSLFAAYIGYYEEQLAGGEKNLCMVSGENQLIANSHPKGILSYSYGAKLISSNDKKDFTFRGRFREPWQAATLGYSVSQKAHSALKWVAADSGTAIGGRAFLCWNPKGIKVPTPATRFSVGKDQKPPTPSSYREDLTLTLLGYRNQLPAHENVVLAIFDAATTGRLSVTYYNELKASDFFDRIQKWYSECCWESGKFGVQPPPLRRIAEYAFGVERSTGGEGGTVEADEKLVRETVQRLHSCMIDGAHIPYGIVSALARRASTPLAYSKGNREGVLSTACAVIRKYHNDKLGKEEWTMAFEPGRLDRSYQFGALLAILEKAELDTYDPEERRETNALRMQSVYCSRPFHTAKLLNERLQPYFQRLKRDWPQNYGFYKSRIGQIMEILDQLAQTGQRLNDPLEETYLLGYYLQRKELYTSHKPTSDDEGGTEK